MGRIGLAIALWLLGGGTAFAQDEGDDDWGLGADESPQDGQDDGQEAWEADGQDGPGDGAEGAEAAGAAGAAGARDWYFGPYLRLNWVPLDFFMGFLFDEAPTVFNPGFGATATYRQEDGPSFQFGLGYVSYSAEGPFRSSGDPDEDTEWVESDLALIHLTGSMLWTARFSELLALEYGFGLDLGIVTGSLVRTEAFPSGGGYAKCPGPGLGNPLYCAPGSAAYDEEGEHYNVEDERVPPIVPLPMLPHLALRVTPMPELALKAEAAFGLVQFWLGLSAAYAPEL